MKNQYKEVWMEVATLFDENGLAMPEPYRTKNFKGLKDEVIKWKIGYEQNKFLKEDILDIIDSENSGLSAEQRLNEIKTLL